MPFSSLKSLPKYMLPISKPFNKQAPRPVQSLNCNGVCYAITLQYFFYFFFYLMRILFQLNFSSSNVQVQVQVQHVLSSVQCPVTCLSKNYSLKMVLKKKTPVLYVFESLKWLTKDYKDLFKFMVLQKCFKWSYYRFPVGYSVIIYCGGLVNYKQGKLFQPLGPYQSSYLNSTVKVNLHNTSFGVQAICIMYSV